MPRGDRAGFSGVLSRRPGTTLGRHGAAADTGENLAAETAAKKPFLPLMRELVRAYQAFAACDAAGYRGVDLTVPQADVIFTLGNTDGLTCKEIGERTLITKGTLTGGERGST